MKDLNPFTGNRFEYDRKHLYYLQYDHLSILEGPKPVYMIGSRGTGKTTLLKALNWSERLENETLRTQLKGELFNGRYIGLYMKLPEIKLSVFDRWIGDFEHYVSIIGMYVDLLWLELASEAISELVICTELFKFNTQNEHDCVSVIIEEYKQLFSEFIPNSSPLTLRGLKNILESVRKRLERTAEDKGDLVKAVQLLDQTGQQVGVFGKKIGKRLSDLCSVDENDKDKWLFKVCMDEGEYLSSKQQLVLNTMVRLSSNPVSFNIAYVYPPEDINSTTLNNLALSNADRDVLELDNASNFKMFAEGVASVRVWNVLHDSSKQVVLEKMFGSLNINEILVEMFKDVTNKQAQILYEEAKSLKENPFFKEKEKVETAPPIYQTYLVKKLGIQIPAPDAPRWKRRGQEAREIRKRMVAGYLSMCEEFKWEPRYCSADMIVQMCDNCIRDFLNQMNYLFIQSGGDLEKFLSTKMKDSKQNIALKEASEKKAHSLEVNGVPRPIEAYRLIYGLAKVTGIIQRRSGGVSHLRSSERGIFVIDVKELKISLALQRTVEFIREAAQAGYFRILSEPTSERLEFRVHTSLAPNYMFSYRGSYYQVPLHLSEIDKLITTINPDDIEAIIEEIAGRIGGEDPLQNTFEGFS